MLHWFWKFCNKRKWFRLANALAYYNASEVEWKMLPGLTPPGLTENKFQSFVNGWCANLYPLGWVYEFDAGFVDSKFQPDITMNFRTDGETLITMESVW